MSGKGESFTMDEKLKSAVILRHLKTGNNLEENSISKMMKILKTGLESDACDLSKST